MTEIAERRLSLTKLIDSSFCVAIDDGNLVHGQIAEGFDQGSSVVVSFAGVKRLTTAFLNAAIGQLYNEYDETLIRERLKVVDASQDDLRLLKSVVDNAKEFFANPERGASILKNMLGDD